MSTEKRVTFAHGEPVVTVTITGWDDAFRFAWAMAHLQCDFSDVGRRVAGSLQRKLGAKRFREWQSKFTGNKNLSWVRDDPPEGYPTWEELQALLPLAAIEPNAGELVLYTGWAVNPDDPSGQLIDWCDNCDSTAGLKPEETCRACGRTASASKQRMAVVGSTPDQSGDSEGGR